MILHLKVHGWTKADLYTTTWGPANDKQAAFNYHSRKYLTYLRKFVEAVLDYTKSDKVNIVSHSMGVTFARKVVKGGLAHDELDGGSYDLGKPLSDRV
jgi:poly(3-hydroxyalkanoate) synthetase